MPQPDVATPRPHLASVRLVDARRSDYLWAIRHATQQAGDTVSTSQDTVIDKSLIVLAVYE